MALTKFTSGINTSFSTELNANLSISLTNQIVNALNLRAIGHDATNGVTEVNFDHSLFDVSTGVTAFNMLYDSTNDQWETIDLTSANLVYMDIYATSVNTATLSDSGNNIHCVQIADGIWRLYSWNGSTDEAINRMFVILFAGMGDADTDPNGVTSITDLRISEATYRDHEVNYMSVSTNGAVDLDATYTVSASSALFLIGDLRGHSGDGHCGNTAGVDGWEINFPSTGTTLHQDSRLNDIDHQDTSTIHSGTGTALQFLDPHHANGSGNYAGILLRPTGTTLTPSITNGSGAITTGDVTISATAPDTATYPLNESTLTTDATTVSGSPTVAILHDDITLAGGGSTTITRSVSFNNGSNYTAVTEDTLTDGITTGTQLRVKLELSRTDNSDIDAIHDYGLFYNS